MIAERYIIILLLLAASVLILSNLGNTYLWQDEAQTALIADSVLGHGVPLGVADRGCYSQEFGADYDAKTGLWLWHPWFPFYLLAGFFLAFGESTFTARLPFALAGIASVLMTYLVARSLGGSRRTGVLAAVALLLCVPFYLLVRQCRYYGLVMFLPLWGINAYLKMVRGRARSWMHLAAASMLLFHTHYVYCVAMLASMVIHAFLYHRALWRRVLLLSAAVAAVNIPWVIFFSPMGGVVARYDSPVGVAMAMMWRYLTQLERFVFPTFLILLPIAAWFAYRARRRASWLSSEEVSGLALLVIYFVVTLIAISLTATQTFFRFLAPLIPVCCIIIGLLLDLGMRVHWGVGSIALALMASWSAMPAYIYELRHDYDGPVEGIVSYLNSHARPGNVVATTYEDLPLKFYTRLKVIGGMTGKDLSPIKQADWVILRKNMPSYQGLAVKEYFELNVPWEKYKPTSINFPDLAYKNREDPELHFYATVRDEDRVVINRRVRR